MVLISQAAEALWVGTWCQDVPRGTALTPLRPAKWSHSLFQNGSVTVTMGNGGAAEHLKKQSFSPHHRFGYTPIFQPWETGKSNRMGVFSVLVLPSVMGHKMMHDI